MRKMFFWLPLAVAFLTVGTPEMRAEKNPWKDMNLSIGDIKVHYLEAGTGDRHLVFLPGLMMIAEVWREQIPYFAARGYHVLALDPRSHGSTTRTPEGNTYLQQAADLYAFLDALEISQPSLVGWSAGVVLLLEYLASPDTSAPAHLVLVDGLPRGARDEDYPMGMTIDQARSFVLGLQGDRDKFLDGFIRSMFKHKQAELLYRQLLEGARRIPAGAAVSLFFDLYSGDRRTALYRIRAPTLIFVPEERAAAGEYLKSKIQGAQLEVIEDAGHALFLDKPQTFNQLLETFLERF